MTRTNPPLWDRRPITPAWLEELLRACEAAQANDNPEAMRIFHKLANPAQIRKLVRKVKS